MKQMPAFETARLILRGVTENDIPAWREHLTDYEVDELLFVARPLNEEYLLPVPGPKVLRLKREKATDYAASHRTRESQRLYKAVPQQGMMTRAL